MKRLWRTYPDAPGYRVGPRRNRRLFGALTATCAVCSGRGTIAFPGSRKVPCRSCRRGAFITYLQRRVRALAVGS